MLFSRNNVKYSVIALMLIVSSTGVHGQTLEESASLKKSLAEGARVKVLPGTVLSVDNAGYYRVEVTSSGFIPSSLCWTSNSDRNKLKDLGTTIWSHAIRKKKDWGAAVHLVYDGSNPDFEAPDFKPNLWAKLFAVHIDGSSSDECQVDKIDFRTFESPLIPMYKVGEPTKTYVQFSTWYNDVAERDRISALVTGGSALLSIVGLPVGNLQPSMHTAVVDEIKAKTDKNRSSKYVTELAPNNALKIEAVGYVALREPPSILDGSEPKVSVKLKPVASIFADNHSSFETVDLSAITANSILKASIRSPVPGDLTRVVYLDTLINNQTLALGSMLSDASDAGASNACGTLGLELQNKLKFSATDAAILLYAAALQRNESGITKHVRDIGCIPNLEAELSRVKITIPQKITDKPGMAITQPAMLDAMNTFAQFKASDADAVPQANWSIFAFPLTVYDPSDRLALENQQAKFTIDNRAELKALIDKNIRNIGCWAYFENPPIEFAPGLGPSVEVSSSSIVRKSAALVKLASDDVQILQFRYNGDPDGAKIDGLAFVRSDNAAKTRMLANISCKEGVPNKEWMQSYLRP